MLARSPARGSVTDDDSRRRRKMTDVSEQNNTSPLGGPLLIAEQRIASDIWTALSTSRNSVAEDHIQDVFFSY